MKALSIKQPFAYLICAGFKDIENRNWSTKFRGRIYVHAAKRDDWNEATDDFIYGVFSGDVPSRIPRLGTNPEQFGAIIGEVDIVDCVTESKSPWFVGKFGFVLRNPTLYATPIPCRGKLGFWEVGLK